MDSWSKRRHARWMSTAAGSVAVLFAGTSLAYAQDANNDEIIVTGFRASLESSAEAKREADSIVEAVTAEEIGKLPDNSIAEALARLPGMTVQRLFGRGQQISVRGLAPDFTTALLNGREQVSAGDNRGVEFDQYPSELLQQVVVYKTPTASLIGQGLAGTADLRTVRPLSVNERVFAVNARYEWNDLGALVEGSDDNGYRATLAYIDQSDDGRWGWALGLSTMSSPTQAERFEAWGYPTEGTGAFILGGAKPYVQSSVLERDAIMGVLEFRPSNTFQTRVDVFYSQFDEEQNLKGIEIPLWWSGQPVQLQPGYTVENGVVTDGTFTGVDPVIRNDLRTRESTVSAIGWNTTWDASDRWTVEADLSYSRVERNDLDLEIYSGTGPGGAGATGTVNFSRGNGSFVFDSNINYADPALIMLTDPQGWGQAGFIKEPQTDDELIALRLSAEREMDAAPFSSWEFGLNVSQREKNKTSIEAFVDLVGGNNQAVPVPAAYLMEPTALEFLGIPGSLSFDPLDLLNNSGLLELRPLLNSDVIVKTWGIEENVIVAYTQLNVDYALWDMPLTGNVGIQFVNTDQESSGGVAGANGPVVVTAGDDYLEMLPALNLSLELADNTFLRFAAARTMARPRMDDMRASFAPSYDTRYADLTNEEVLASAQTGSGITSFWGGSGGNPYLRPWIADAYDLSFERYIGDAGGYFAVALFYKNLESYIYNQTAAFDFTGFPVTATDINGDPIVPASTIGFASVPVNASGGYIQGVEFSLSLPFETLTPMLEGFGLVFNASSTDSNVRPPNTEGNALPGLSETVINTTLYFERAGFEARVSNRYRSDFLGEVTGFGAGRELRTVNGESVLDAQVGYRFQEGSLEGLAVQFQANNITNEPFSTYSNGDERLIRDFQRYGTTYLFGVSFRH